MNPEIFPILKNTPAVMALLGSGGVLRFYPYADAPQNATKPYATYGVYNGNPENYLDRVPDIDNMGTQIEIWADNSTQCEAIFTVLRDTLEPLGHMTNFASTRRDFETQLYNARMEFDFWVKR